MPTTTAFRGGASVRALKEGDTSITITAGSIVKTIPVSVWGNKWVLPTLPATRNGITFTAAGDGMVHAKGTATDWATILVTQDLPAGTIMTNNFTALQSSERILFTETTLGVPVIDATDEVWALGSGLTISDMIHPTAEGAVKLGQILGRHIKQAIQQ